jgi:hypothetical protein
MRKENLNGKKELEVRKYKTENCQKKLHLQAISILNQIFFKKESLMNFKKVKSV